MKLKKEKKIPIIVGGTGLYFNSLINGLVKIPNIPLRFRYKIRSIQKKLGQRKFYEKLLKIDPKVKDKINRNDTQRSMRAYEIKIYSKKSIYEWLSETKSNFDQNDFLKIYLNFERKELINRIQKRTNQMFKFGAIKEVKKILKLKFSSQSSVKKIIGIQEINRFLEDKISLDQTKELINIRTRQYAKRQVTWARSKMVNWREVSPSEFQSWVKEINFN